MSELTIGSLVRMRRLGGVAVRNAPPPGWTGVIATMTASTALCRHAEEQCDCDPEDHSCYRCDGTGGATRRRLGLDVLEADRRRMIRALILRRRYARRATLADLRAARGAALVAAREHPFLRLLSLRSALRGHWSDAIRDRLGGIDEVLAICHGRLHRLFRLRPRVPGNRMYGPAALASAIYDLLQHADDIQYWQRPQAIRLDLRHQIPMLLSTSQYMRRVRRARWIS